MTRSRRPSSPASSIRSAELALEAYIKARRVTPEDAAEDYTITDLITNLLHLAERRNPGSAEFLNSSAWDHFQSEEVCRDCGDAYDDDGEGYDGRCGSCADKAERKRC